MTIRKTLLWATMTLTTAWAANVALSSEARACGVAPEKPSAWAATLVTTVARTDAGVIFRVTHEKAEADTALLDIAVLQGDQSIAGKLSTLQTISPISEINEPGTAYLLWVPDAPLAESSTFTLRITPKDGTPGVDASFSTSTVVTKPTEAPGLEATANEVRIEEWSCCEGSGGCGSYPIDPYPANRPVAYPAPPKPPNGFCDTIAAYDAPTLDVAIDLLPAADRPYFTYEIFATSTPTDSVTVIGWRPEWVKATKGVLHRVIVSDPTSCAVVRVLDLQGNEVSNQKVCPAFPAPTPDLKTYCENANKPCNSQLLPGAEAVVDKYCKGGAGAPGAAGAPTGEGGSAGAPPVGAGGSPAQASAGSGGASTTSAAPADATTDEGDGCSVHAPLGGAASPTAAVGLVALAAAGLRRKRRSAR